MKISKHVMNKLSIKICAQILNFYVIQMNANQGCISIFWIGQKCYFRETVLTINATRKLDTYKAS